MNIYIAMGNTAVRDSFFTPNALEKVRELGDIRLFDGPELCCGKETLMKELEETEVLFTGWGAPRIDEEILAHARRLKIHAHVGGSVAPYISKEEYDRGIRVLSGNDLYAKSVAEGCLTYTLMALRQLPGVISFMQKEGWKPDVVMDNGLIGKKVGLVGYGAIARYYAELLKWFQVDLSVYSGHISEEELHRIGARRASKEEIFANCDVISLHSALNDANYGMITSDLIKLIKKDALFVNTARAGLIDSASLMAELETGRFRAVLDVYDEEPLPLDSPYRRMPNVMLLPHVAGPTSDMREVVVLSLAEDILKIDRGEPARHSIPYDYAIRMTK